jgi:hypothetical protein
MFGTTPDSQDLKMVINEENKVGNCTVTPLY